MILKILNTRIDSQKTHHIFIDSIMNNHQLEEAISEIHLFMFASYSAFKIFGATTSIWSFLRFLE